jgi:predicted  nucleic acid-binding Zn-ribbon protein
MPHQCVKCSKIIPIGSKELLIGCSNCGGKFFFYIKQEQLERIKRQTIEIPEVDKSNIERDIREMVGITDEETPVILDLESVRVVGDGKFEIDLVNVFNTKRPLIYKLEEGKYIIDLASTLSRSVKDLKEIRNPYEKD